MINISESQRMANSGSMHYKRDYVRHYVVYGILTYLQFSLSISRMDRVITQHPKRI